VRRSYRNVDKSTGLRSDYTIILCGPKSSERYPDPLRRIGYYSEEMKKKFVFLTNNFTLPPLTIAKLYKCRWQIELFFKWIKQYLRIKAFYGNSIKAVKTQIWTAICVYVLVAIVRKELRIERTLGEILQILSISLFEKTPIFQAFSQQSITIGESTIHNQLELFDI
jgi:Transposase DDE domain